MAYNREVEFRNVVLHNLFVPRLVQIERQIRKINISESPDMELREKLIKEREYLYAEARELKIDTSAIMVSVREAITLGLNS